MILQEQYNYSHQNQVQHVQTFKPLETRDFSIFELAAHLGDDTSLSNAHLGETSFTLGRPSLWI